MGLHIRMWHPELATALIPIAAQKRANESTSEREAGYVGPLSLSLSATSCCSLHHQLCTSVLLTLVTKQPHTAKFEVWLRHMLHDGHDDHMKDSQNHPCIIPKRGPPQPSCNARIPLDGPLLSLEDATFCNRFSSGERAQKIAVADRPRILVL